MWYNRTILAAIEDAINALQSKGVSEEIIQFVHSLPDNQKGKAIGALNQNPSMMIDDLKNLFQSGYRPSSQELQLTQDYDPKFKSWALYQYKQLRANKLNDDPKDDRWEYKQSITGYSGIKDDLDEIHDFFRGHVLDNPNYNLGTKSFQEAYDDSVEWHNAISQRGSGKFYLPFKRDESGNIVDEKIVHRFEDGSMMVRVEDPNDLDVEGNFMHHCVGSYAREVESGYCTIYSLRNKFNNPEATIEVDNDGKVKQIKGPSNSSITDDEQVEKIKEFFEGRDDIKKQSGEGYAHRRANEWDNSEVDWSTYPDEVEYAMREFAYGPYIEDDDDEDYGDFARFGISPRTWENEDQSQFEEENLSNVDVNVMVDEAIKTIDKGTTADRYSKNHNLDDYDFDKLSDIAVEVAFNKLKQEVDSIYLPEDIDADGYSWYDRFGGKELYLKKTADKIIGKNPLRDLIFGFAEKFDEFERFIRDTAVEFVGDVGRTAFDNMNETENRLRTDVVKKIYDKALDHPVIEKFEEITNTKFVLPKVSDFELEYPPKMNYITGASEFNEDPNQLRFQDLPEGESFNLARFRKKQQIQDDEEELIIPDEFE
jgi:hypothetical protein